MFSAAEIPPVRWYPRIKFDVKESVPDDMRGLELPPQKPGIVNTVTVVVDDCNHMGWCFGGTIVDWSLRAVERYCKCSIPYGRQMVKDHFGIKSA
jgi:hypothetical protein